MARLVKPGSDLSLVPNITFAFVEDYVQQNSTSAGSSQLNKGFKYYSEGFISNLKTYCDGPSCRLSASCYRSQRKNKAPHKLEIYLNRCPPRVESALCDCAIGKGQSCGHITGTLYLVAHYKLRGLSAIPADVVKTSIPQTWHIPRGDKIHGMSVQEVRVTGYSKDQPSDKPVKSTLYNPIRSPLPPLEELISTLQTVSPSCSLLTSLPPASLIPPSTVSTKFGLFPSGSAISYQQQLAPSFVFNILDSGFPDLPDSNNNIGSNCYTTVLTETQGQMLESLSVSQEESVGIEKSTRLQAGDPKWKKLREHRVTASKVGEISKRIKNPEEYAARYKTSTGNRMTAAMKEGVANEPVTASAYSNIKGNTINIYPSGIIVSPAAPWLAATPNRKVFDPSQDPPYGLLEIKCPDLAQKEKEQLPYLKLHVNGSISLKKNHNYYHQIQMQLAVSGLMWCDFFVWSTKSTHLERIMFEMTEWQPVKDKADKLYFDHIL